MSLQREAGESQAVHTLTLAPAPWPSGIRECRVCGAQELLGWRGWDSARNGGVGFVKEVPGVPGLSESHKPSDKGHRVSVALCSGTWSTDLLQAQLGWGAE